MDVIAEDFLARLRAFVRRRVGATVDAEDVVQTVLLRLLQTRDEVALESPVGWVLTTARTVIADLHRSRVRSGSAIDEEPAETPKVDDERDVTQCLVPLLRTLPEDDRRLLERVDMNGEPQSSLSVEHGITV